MVNTTEKAMSKSGTFNISLTDEMKQFIVSQYGSGTLYASPSEYIRDLIRHERDRIETQKLRSAILEGYQDIFHGSAQEFSGDLMADLKKHSQSKKS